MTLALADNSTSLNGLSIEDLRALLRSVSDTTERLHATHTTLHQQVARLQQELADANEQLRRTKQLAALGEMAAGIAHEIRNPLGSIQLYAQMLEDDLKHDDDQAAVCRKISKAVTGLDAIVRDVLLFARDTVVRPEPMDPADLFESALSNCQSLITGRNVNIIRRFTNNLEFEGDATLLTQALTNLIRNAIEAMTEANVSNPRLVLESSSTTVRVPGKSEGKGNVGRERRIMLAVEDNGPGIPDDARKRMFNPFFTTRATGTGLGLAIVHRITDAHGGFINVRNISNTPARSTIDGQKNSGGGGGGARFELLLPFSPNEDYSHVAHDAQPVIEIKPVDLLSSTLSDSG